MSAQDPFMNDVGIQLSQSCMSEKLKAYLGNTTNYQSIIQKALQMEHSDKLEDEAWNETVSEFSRSCDKCFHLHNPEYVSRMECRDCSGCNRFMPIDQHFSDITNGRG